MLSYLEETPERLAHATAIIGATSLDHQQFLSTLSISPHDTVTLDASIAGGIKEVRQFSAGLLLSPQFGPVRLGIIIQAESLSPPAQNALLKLLEEPPQRVKIVLFIAQEQAVLPTLLSRCRRYYVSRYEKNREFDQSPHSLLERFIAAEDQAKNDEALAVVTQELTGRFEEWQRSGYKSAHYTTVDTVFQAYHELKRGVNSRLILETLVLSSRG